MSQVLCLSSPKNNECIQILKDVLFEKDEEIAMSKEIENFNLIGDYIYHFRTNDKLTIEQLAKELNISSSKLVKIETSQIAPTENNLFALKKIFGKNFNVSQANFLLQRTKLYIEYPDLFRLFEKSEKENRILRDLLTKRDSKKY